MASELSNHFKYQLSTKKIDFSADSFKIVLMGSGFTAFLKDTHATYSDVSANEMATGNGYTQNTKTLSGVTVTEDDANDRAAVTWSNVVWTASGGSIGPSVGAIIVDDTTADKTVVGFIDFNGSQTATDGGTFTITAPTFYLT